jgi:hypothetical protein
MLQLRVGRSTTSSIESIIVDNNGNTIEWILKSFNKTRVFKIGTIFETINEYLATLDADTADKIFSVYEEIFSDITYSTCEVGTLLEHLKPKASELLELLNLDGLEHYCGYHGVFHYPPLSSAYSEAEPRESTYIRSDYSGLLFLTTALKMILPIWGELIDRIAKEVGATFKEQICLSILGDSSLFKMKDMLRLVEYIDGMADKTVLPDTAIHNHIGTEQLRDWLLGRVVVRRLAISETNVANVSLISNIYNTIISTTDKMDGRFSVKIRNKRKLNEMADQEDNVSLAERQKTKQYIADNYVIGFEEYVLDVHKFAEGVYPHVDHKMLDEFIEANRATGPIEPRDWCLGICGLLVNHKLPSRCLESLSQESILIVVSLCQVLLVQLGHYELMFMLTAKSVERPLDEMSGDGTMGAHRSRISKENMERLVELYPYYRQGSRAQMGAKATGTLPFNIWIEHVNKVTQGLDWVYNSPIVGKITIPTEGRPKTIEVINGRTFNIPNDIKNQLATLIVKVKGDRLLIAQ